MAFKRAHHRAEFDSNLSTSDINQFVDDFYNYCVKNSVDGLIVEADIGGCFILEGDDSGVDNALNYLDSANELVSNDTYLVETTGGSFYTCLSSFVSADARNSNC
ncbi:hypothetical protein FIV42_18660 [Persicimonas caeni]|uniref:Uncharacterized protein n=1 Tax=Persicimonas caeni TaxID=2292766 RepID=A0A4Y6PWJ3_PERCE|nr:hypothetical protein [Persicimonas caeni]QDG52686.1 hypothetical protein FIV42_18660 [Persicimonas caeni]QED33908.1 hypothetical protein FRD00_18655 [Persicimonas caeni]